MSLSELHCYKCNRNFNIYTKEYDKEVKDLSGTWKKSDTFHFWCLTCVIEFYKDRPMLKGNRFYKILEARYPELDSYIVATEL